MTRGILKKNNACIGSKKFFPLYAKTLNHEYVLRNDDFIGVKIYS